MSVHTPSNHMVYNCLLLQQLIPFCCCFYARSVVNDSSRYFMTTTPPRYDVVEMNRRVQVRVRPRCRLHTLPVDLLSHTHTLRFVDHGWSSTQEHHPRGDPGNVSRPLSNARLLNSLMNSAQTNLTRLDQPASPRHLINQLVKRICSTESPKHAGHPNK